MTPARSGRVMSARQPRFEVVRSDAGWFARFIAANGREVWRTSETYTQKKGATNALHVITSAFSPTGQSWVDQIPRTRGNPFPSVRMGHLGGSMYSTARRFALREVDERTAP